MEEKKESERVREEVARKCAEIGFKRTRHLSLDEGREFLASDKFPAEALGKSTFSATAHADALPDGSTCLCCRRDLSGQEGWVVQVGEKKLMTICPEHFAVVNAEKQAAAAPTAAPESAQAAQTDAQATAPAAPGNPGAAPGSPGDPIAAALAVLAKAVNTPKPPPVDEKRILAEAERIATTVAEQKAEGYMQKSLATLLREGAAAFAGSAGAGGFASAPSAEDKLLPKAKGDGVASAAAASGWSAKATAPAVDAVKKLNKFLSEFSYFHDGASMRLINSFAIADDKKEFLKSYCEVSQMEDLPDLVAKMKSPEFDEVLKAYSPFKPKTLNKRFAVFYGAPGGGKTYAAQKAGESINGGKCDAVPCSPSMDAADMLYAYRLDYETNRRGYVPTALLTAMLAGRAVVLDEINLLPMEARMFLQNILDNKAAVHIMGVEIPIRDGFFVIGTMNLETGLGAQPLPLPLVDRAAVVRKFTTTPSQAAVGAGLC